MGLQKGAGCGKGRFAHFSVVPSVVTYSRFAGLGRLNTRTFMFRPPPAMVVPSARSPPHPGSPSPLARADIESSSSFGGFPFLHERSRSLLWLFFDGRADEAAPLGPGAIVVAHIRVAQQVGQHEPGVAAALADTTIGNDLFVGSDALSFIQGA